MKIRCGAGKSLTAVKCVLPNNEWGKEPGACLKTTVFKHGHFCATVLYFGAGFYQTLCGAVRVSAVVTVLNRGRAGIVWKCEWPRYSSAGCFPEYPISTRCLGNSVVFGATVAARDRGGACCPPLRGNATSTKFPPSDMSDVCYCLPLLRSLSCSFFEAIV